MKNKKEIGFYGGLNFGFIENRSAGRISAGFFGNRTGVKNGCNYNFAGLLGGLRFFSNSSFEQQFIFKLNYNIVNSYNYDRYSDNGSGKSSGFQTFDDEHLSYKIPNFISGQFAYVIVKKFGSKSYFVSQAGMLICESIYTHNYSYNNDDPSSIKIDKSRAHPFYYPFNLSFGFGIFLLLHFVKLIKLVYGFY